MLRTEGGEHFGSAGGGKGSGEPLECGASKETGGMAKRVAALYDIHGNLPALEAVLDEIRHADVDHVVVGGDVLPGPMLPETLTCLQRLDLPVEFIQGNCEVAVLAQISGTQPSWMRRAPED